MIQKTCPKKTVASSPGLQKCGSKRNEISEYIHPTHYNMRSIATLKKLSDWNQTDIENNFRHNRIFQDGFLSRPAAEVFQDAIATKAEWLTDFICPSQEASWRMHIASHLSCFYQVTSEDLDCVTEKVFQVFLTKISVEKIEEQIKEKMASLSKETDQNDIVLHAMHQIYPNLEKSDSKYQKILESFMRINQDKLMKKSSDLVIHFHLNDLMDQITQDLHINPKPTRPQGENRDHIFLGAAGSGKSSIVRQKLHPSYAETSIILATDNYRAVSFGDVDSKLTDEQAFIKTQDTAYLIKELIQKNLQSLDGNRPDVVIDVITLEPWMKALVRENHEKTSVSVACLPAADQVPLRAYQRAQDPQSAPADKGRHVNTQSLIEGHRRGSEFLLKGLPTHPQITLYNTNTKDRVARKIAEINNTDHSIAINDLSKMGLFLGKKHLNPNATSEAELYYDLKKDSDRFQYTVKHQAKAILSLISDSGQSEQNYHLILQDQNGKNHARVEKNPNGQFELIVLDQSILLQEYLGKNRSILTEIIQQTGPFQGKDYLGRTLAQRQSLQNLSLI